MTPPRQGDGTSSPRRAGGAAAPPSDLLDDESLLDLRRRAKATDPAAVLDEERRRREATPAWHPSTPPDGGLTTRPTEPAPPDGSAHANGLCALCKTRPARGTCALCGRGACAADLWVMLRLCRACANERDVERGQRPARPEPANWLADGGTGGRPRRGAP